MSLIVPVDALARGTTDAAWQIHYAMREHYGDIRACSRTAFAELYRYDDPGHPEDGTWSFQVVDRRSTAENVGQGWVQWLVHPAALRPFVTWRECFDAAHAAVSELRGAA